MAPTNDNWIQLSHNWVPTELQLSHNWVPTNSNWTPTELQLSSKWTPTELQLNPNWAPTELQLSSIWATTEPQLSHFWVPTNSNWAPTELQMNSNWTSMENWNRDLPERYSKFRGLYIKFQGHGKWPWTWWGPRKRQGHWPRPPGQWKWRKACINTCNTYLSSQTVYY